MRTLNLCCGLILATCMLVQSGTYGQTAMVNPDGTGDFTTIQLAIDSAGFEPEILVFPGRYEENITISRNVTIRSLEGSFFTCIRGDISDDTVTFGGGVVAQLIGFSITNGRNGVVVNSTAMAKIKNCVIHDNMQSGIMATWIFGEVLTDLEILNNVIQNNLSDGIRLVGGDVTSDNRDSFAFPTLVQNNALLSNQGFGLQILTDLLAPVTSSIISPELLVIDHNNTPGNLLGNWGPRIGTDVDVDVGPNNIQESPGFVGQLGGCGPDARLIRGGLLTSAMVDAGNPGVAFRDADSSVNDIGAFGGPDAADFFESPLDGPLVRSVTLAPAVVPQGEMFSVEAVVAVR